MRRFIHKLFNALRPNDKARPAMRHSTRNIRPAVELLEERALLSSASLAPVNSYVQTNLVSNVPGLALITDPELVNPWDVNFPQLPGINPPIVVADQGSGVATSYQISGLTVTESSSPVTIPTVGSSEPSGPTGVVQNVHPSNEFLIPGTDIQTTYIFDTLQGTIVGAYANGATTSAEVVVNNSPTAKNSLAGAEYTGLAVGTYDGTSDDGPNYIYAANEGTNPGIQVFDSSFNPVNLAKDFAGNFTDPDLPAGFIPYGVRDLSLGSGQDHLFVTYRSPNFQGGAIAEFNNDGTFVCQLGSDTAPTGRLQSPWGLAFIQQGFGGFSDDLMVGNFSSGQIDAYAYLAASGTFQFQGKVQNANGAVLEIPGLRTIHFGPGLGDSVSTHVGLLFTASGNDLYSLYGEIEPAAATTSANWIVSDHTLYVYGDQTATNDTISVEDNGIDGGVMVTMNGESISFPYGEILAIDIYPETGANTVGVLNTNVPVTIYDTSSDSVQIGNDDDGLQGIKAGVDLAKSNSLVDLTITDTHDSIGHSDVILNGDELLGMSPLPIHWGDNVAYLTVTGGSGNNTYNVLGTGSLQSVNLNTGPGYDVVNIGDPSHPASDIREILQVNGQGGNDTLTVDDHANTNTEDYVLTDDSISNHILGIGYSGIGTVALKGSSAGSSYSIFSTAANVFYSIKGGGGADSFNISNLYQSLTTIAGNLTINGGGGDSLTVDSGQDGTCTYSVYSGLIYGLDAYIYYSSMARVFLNGSSFGGSDYFIFSTAAGTSYTINAGVGADTFDICPPIFQVFGANLDAIAGPVLINGGGAGDKYAGTDSLSVTDQNSTANDTYSISTGVIMRTGAAKITYAGVSTVTLDGGNGNDAFDIKSFDPTVYFAITGGSGVNTLDYAAFSGDVTVDLPLGLATGLSGGISNIQNVTGSKGNDILVGDVNPNVLIGGTGMNLIIGGMGADTLVGGPNGDILIGDYTDYDTNIAALNAIMAEWDSVDSYATRYDFITSGDGLNDSYVLNTTTVHNDLAKDKLTGKAGRDWFFVSSGDILTDAVTSGPNKEYITTI